MAVLLDTETDPMNVVAIARSKKGTVVQPNDTVAWSVSDAGVIQLGPNGAACTLTAVSVGTATVTATAHNRGNATLTGTLELIVSAPDADTLTVEVQTGL